MVEHAEPVTGKGIRVTVNGHVVAVGTAELIDEKTDPSRVLELNEQGRTAMYVGMDGHTIGIVAVADTVRKDTQRAIDDLHKRGIKVIMATGDAQRVADTVTAELGVDEVHAEMMPEDKLELVKSLQEQGKTVAMLGDGVNDTPALAQADIGVAMGAAGSPAVIETADIALMADRLTRLPYAFGLAQRTVRTMRINIVIALLTVAVLLAGVLIGGVTMSIGMLVHEASVLLVIVIAMLLLRQPRFAELGFSCRRGAAWLPGAPIVNCPSLNSQAQWSGVSGNMVRQANSITGCSRSQFVNQIIRRFCWDWRIAGGA